VIAVSGMWLGMRPSPAAPAVAEPVEAWTPQRLTSSGNLRALVTLSPDGRYVAYPELGPGGQRLVLRQIATNTVAELRPPERGLINGVTFSPDGNFLYYCVYPPGNNMATLYRMPSIGGTSVRVLNNIDSPVAFSPGGDRIAFGVNYPVEGRSTLEVARADGSDQRVLAELKRPSLVTNRRPAWSPDGTTIAAPVVAGGGQAVALVDTTTGTLRLAGDKRWPVVTGTAWTPDGRGLIVALRVEGAAAGQVWRLDAASGALTPVTRDLFNYVDVGMSADGRLIAATIGLPESTIWTADSARPNEPTQLTTGGGDAEGALGLIGLGDGHVVFTASTAGNPDLWTLDPATGARRQLTTDPGDDTTPVVSPDGQWLAFVSTRGGGSRIWLMNVDGKEQRALTAGPFDRLPVWTPDSSAILFIAGSAPTRISTSGGTAEPLAGHWPARPGEPQRAFIPRAVSRSGSVAGFEEYDPRGGGGWRLAVAPLDGSAPPRSLGATFTTATNQPVSWAPDGKAIDVLEPQQAFNIMRYTVDERPGARFTNFSPPVLTRTFAWSFDGRTLLLSRGENKNDIVLLRRSDAR
jgi:Tol biopolymer transport system component